MAADAGDSAAAAAGLTEQEFMDKFSRQNAALGAETTKKMTKMQILMVGVNGAAIEVAKNLALQGCGGITLFAPEAAKQRDCGVNFFVHPEDEGQPIEKVVAPRLLELNPFCSVKASGVSDLTDDLVKSHSVIVVRGKLYSMYQ
jgi:molybdopterin/thiamine biosynthesis adenylyltransferase